MIAYNTRGPLDFSGIRIMIVLFTDFGVDDIYVARVKAVLLQQAAARTPILDLLHGARILTRAQGPICSRRCKPRSPPARYSWP